MSDFFEINFKKLVRERIPPRLRTQKIMAFVDALSVEINGVYNDFIRNRKANLYRLSITPQVVYLEKLLNDKYDFTARRIYIYDAEWHQPWYIYKDEELKPERLYQESEEKPVWLYSENEVGELKIDFVVFVPSAVDFKENEMRGYLDMYKLFGTHYKIERV